MAEQLAAQPVHPEQRMGPFEEGDQALTDVARTLPEGELRVKGADGSLIRIAKTEGHGGTQVLAKTTEPEPARSVEQTIVRIDSAGTGTEGISASVSETPNGSHRNAYASGNEAGDVISVHADRRQAQTIKLDAANRIKSMAAEAARQQHEAQA